MRAEARPGGPRVDVGLIRGTSADENDNIAMENDGMFTAAISIAQAARRCGGIVIALAKQLVSNGTLRTP